MACDVAAVLFRGTTTDGELNFTVTCAVAKAPRYLLLSCFKAALEKGGACAETEEARALLNAATAAGVAIPSPHAARAAAAAAQHAAAAQRARAAVLRHGREL